MQQLESNFLDHRNWDDFIPTQDFPNHYEDYRAQAIKQALVDAPYGWIYYDAVFLNLGYRAKNVKDDLLRDNKIDVLKKIDDLIETVRMLEGMFHDTYCKFDNPNQKIPKIIREKFIKQIRKAYQFIAKHNGA